MRLSLGLRPKIILGTLLILALSLAVSGVLHLTDERNRLEKALKANGESLASLVAHFCASPIEKYSYYIVQEVARNVEQADDVVFCEIYDANGNSLVQIDTTIRGREIPKKKRRTGDDVLIVEHPIENNSVQLGKVEIGLHMEPIKKELWSHTIGMITSILILLFLVAILINIYLSYAFVTPVVNLSENVKDLSKGDFDKTAFDTAQRNDEIGDLARAFNLMSQNLKHLYKNLEKKVHERTADLARTNLQLQQEVQVRQSTEVKLKNAKEAAERANRYKSNFVANISHEIRTPLNAILGYAQILQSRNGLNENDRKALEAIDRGGSHLLGLINDILDLSKIEAGRVELNPSPFDLSLLIRNMASMFQLRCMEKNLTWQVVGIDTNKVIPVFADSGKLRQVLINLLGNAVKFTDKGSVILRLNHMGDDRFRFCIEDTGRGIPDNVKPLIFRPFSDISGKTGKEGTGLGLSITSSFLAMMNSKVELLDNNPTGCRFCFDITLPAVAKSSLPEEPQPYKIIGLVSDRHISALVVDDDELSRTMLAHLLNKIDVNTLEAGNGVEALEVLRNNSPDIIFMDRYMPKMDGLETIKEIHQHYGEKAPPIVMITAAAFEAENESIEDIGVADILIKPCDIGRVLKCMSAVLNLPLNKEAEERSQAIKQDKDTKIDVTKVHLPLELLHQILDAAEYGRISELKQIIAQLESGPHRNRTLTKLVQKHMETYSLGEISQLMKEIISAKKQ